MGTLALAALAFIVLAGAGGSKSSGEPTPAPTPDPSNGGGGDDPVFDPDPSLDDPSIGPDGFPQIVFYEDGTWAEPSFDWFGYASNQMLGMLPPPDASAPEGNYGEFDFAYILAWEFLADEVPEELPYPNEPYAPNGEMWQTNIPGQVNYFDGPYAILGLIEHLAAYIDGALPHYNQTGEFDLLPEGMF